MNWPGWKHEYWPYGTKTQAALEQFDRFFSACEMVSLNREVFEQATLLRAKNQLKTPDALHLGAAIHAGCIEFWTNDKQLKAIASHYLKVVDWSVLDTRH